MSELERINTIVGPERREALLMARADRLIIDWGMSADMARRYAEGEWANCEPGVLVSPGQVWELKDGRRDPLDELLGVRDNVFRIAEVDRAEQMVGDGSGRRMNYVSYLGQHYRLASWHEEYLPGAENPQAPAEPATVEETSETTEEEGFDPRSLFLSVQRSSDRSADVIGSWLPMLGDFYRTRLGRGGKGNFVSLDVLGYLAANLEDFRAGYWQWHDTEWVPAGRRGVPRFLEFFNELCFEEPETDAVLTAYLGSWLLNRIRSDAAREHGGTAGEYDAGFMWGAAVGDSIFPAVPGSDPRQELPVDHPLVQCPGQGDLFSAAVEAGAA